MRGTLPHIFRIYLAPLRHDIGMAHSQHRSDKKGDITHT